MRNIITRAVYRGHPMPVAIHPLIIACIICTGCCSLTCLCGGRHVDGYVHSFYRENITHVIHNIIRIHPAPQPQSMETMEGTSAKKYAIIIDPTQEYHIGVVQ